MFGVYVSHTFGVVMRVVVALTLAERSIFSRVAPIMSIGIFSPLPTLY